VEIILGFFGVIFGASTELYMTKLFLNFLIETVFKIFCGFEKTIPNLINPKHLIQNSFIKIYEKPIKLMKSQLYFPVKLSENFKDVFLKIIFFSCGFQ
jgi:hypothetical protein